MALRSVVIRQNKGQLIEDKVRELRRSTVKDLKGKLDAVGLSKGGLKEALCLRYATHLIDAQLYATHTRDEEADVHLA